RHHALQARPAHDHLREVRQLGHEGAIGRAGNPCPIIDRFHAEPPHRAGVLKAPMPPRSVISIDRWLNAGLEIYRRIAGSRRRARATATAPPRSRQLPSPGSPRRSLRRGRTIPTWRSAPASEPLAPARCCRYLLPPGTNPNRSPRRRRGTMRARGSLFLPTFLVLAGTASSALAQSEAPKPDSGDTAWMLTSTALVLMMTVPGL